MTFRLDPGSGVPTYLQLVHQVEQALRIGSLGPGDRLPRVKDVVATLVINPNTVLKAYRELETKGLTVGRPGVGTFIDASLQPTTFPELTALRRRLDRWLAEAEGVGMDEDGIEALFRSVQRERRDGPTSSAPRRPRSGDEEGVA
jgi:GntR family transcriptional regulator